MCLLDALYNCKKNGKKRIRIVENKSSIFIHEYNTGGKKIITNPNELLT